MARRVFIRHLGARVERDTMPEMSLEKATGIRNPLPWLAGAALGPGLAASVGGGSPLFTIGLPLAAATMGKGAVKAVGQGATAAVGLQLLSPALQNAAGGILPGASASGGHPALEGL